ncbi:uncharacterized protein [Antedon mediterranea]|uniref:uncharacterized protein n=1 Tax=Antedon mediterranea TaxID=105859 RepID=UPI003AF943C9
MASKSSTCLLDPIPSKLLKECLDELIPTICDIVNRSLSCGTVPDIFKAARLTPLIKKLSLDPEILKNYRPISNLSFISKILERCVAAQLTKHLVTNDLHGKRQSAYRKHHSTETSLIRVINDLLRAVDVHSEAVLVLLDLTAAFDTINHKILLQRLSNRYGVDGTVLKWFQSYMLNRTQSVAIKESTSNPSPLLDGVPQGSVLGPLCFTLYTSPLEDIVSSYDGVELMVYADDTQLYMMFNPLQTDSAISQLESCIQEVKKWMVVNQLKLNSGKTEVLHITSRSLRNNNQIDQIQVGSEFVLTVPSARNLGITIDNKLSMSGHINNICKSANFALRKIGQVRKYLDRGSAKKLIHAFVSSRLDCCNSLLCGLPDYEIAKLQLVQNTAARMITLTKKRHSITPVLKELHWLPVCKRITFKISLITYNALHGLAPDYIRELISEYIPSRSLRSGDQFLLTLPKSSTAWSLLIITSSTADLLIWTEVDTSNSQPNSKLATFNMKTNIPEGTNTATMKYNLTPAKFVALDYDYSDRLIFFSANVRAAVYKVRMDVSSGGTSVIFGGTKNVEGIAVDWLAKNLYIIDQTYDWIFVINYRNNTGNNRILMREGLDKPRGIAVHPIKGLLFWSDCGKVPKIEKSNLDGTNRTDFITTDITSPNGLSIDYADNRLYWTDVGNGFSKVESCNLDGSDRRIFYNESEATSEFFKLKVYKNYVYITDRRSSIIWSINKTTEEAYFNMDLDSPPYGITIYGNNGQVEQTSPCLSNPCSHVCTSADNNGYRCLCKDSYSLSSDGVCQPDGFFLPTPALLYSYGTSIRKMNNFPHILFPKERTSIDQLLNNQHKIIALEADVTRRILFFSDENVKSIFSFDLKVGGKRRRMVSSNLGSVRGIAIDYLSKSLYWTDYSNNHIMVSSYDGQYRHVLIDTDIVQPTSIEVDPIHRYMFWIERGSSTHIERARLDGSNRTIIVSDLSQASGMTLDFNLKRLYFANSGTIESVDYDGNSRNVLYVNKKAIYFDMDIFQDFLLLTENVNGSLHVLNRETTEFLHSLQTSGQVYGILTLDFTRQPSGISPCMNNTGCEQICLPESEENFTCECSMGFIAEGNGKCNSTIVEDNFILAVDTGRKTTYQIDLQEANSRDYAHTALYIGPLENPIAVGFDPVDRYVYVSDVNAHLIKRSLLDGRKFEIIHPDVYVPDGLAVDHIHRLLFWSDGANGAIYVSGLDGSSKTILISSNIEKPRAIDVDPIRGLLFWTDWGTEAKIESSWMDGSNRRVLIDTTIGWPNGIALETKHQFLYWCDAQMNRIERVKYDGSQRTLMKHLDYSAHPFDIVVDDSFIYFTDWSKKTLMRMNKVVDDELVAVGEDVFGRLSGLALYNSRVLETGETSCTQNNGGCGKLCLATPKARTCVDDGILRRGCSVEIPNGRTSGCDRMANSVCLIVCNSGYQTLSRTNVTCLPSGEWEGFVDLFCIETLCPRLKAPVNANGYCNSLKKTGEVCNFQCLEGYVNVIGDVRRVCQADGTWSGNDLLCGAITCQALALPAFSNGDQCPQPSVFRSTCSFSCQQGSKKVGGNETRVCQEDGTWSGQALSCSGCGTVTSPETVLHQKRRDEGLQVVSRRDSVRGSAPWMVRLYHFRKNKNFCGGSILNSEWIITAAHCINGLISVKKKNTIIRLADNHRDYYRIRKLVTHVDFNANTYNADIAMIKLETPISNFTDYVRPICLPTNNLTSKIMKRGQLGRVNGWERGGQTPQLKEMYLPVVRQRKCITSTKHTVTRKMFCAGYAQKGTNACNGEDGGSFSIFRDNRWYLFGIVSWGEDCSQPGKYRFYTRIPAFLDWIDKIIIEG